jgi:hypothetical protein
MVTDFLSTFVDQSKLHAFLSILQNKMCFWQNLNQEKLFRPFCFAAI